MRRLRRKKAGKASELSGKKISGKMLLVICSIIAVIVAAATGVWSCTAGGMAEPAANTQDKDSDPSKDGESQETGGNAEKSESEDSSGGDNSGSNAHVTLRSSNKRQGQMLHAIPYSPRIDSKKTGNNS